MSQPPPSRLFCESRSHHMPSPAPIRTSLDHIALGFEFEIPWNPTNLSVSLTNPSEAGSPTESLWSKSCISGSSQLSPAQDELRDSPPTAPPDGGSLAWSQVVAGHLVAFNSWGYVNSFGVFQAYYTVALQQNPSAISWVGGVQIFLMMSIGIFSGRAMDGGYYWQLAVLGITIQVLGVFLTSFISEYWQLLLAQGLCQGIGSGLVFTPTMAVVGSYFTGQKALAICGMSSGTATGGVVFPIIARQLLPKVGIAWTVRVMGSVFLANGAVALSLIRPRPVPRKGGALFEARSFLDVWFSLFSLGMFLGVLGLYFTYYYVSRFQHLGQHVLTQSRSHLSGSLSCT